MHITMDRSTHILTWNGPNIITWYMNDISRYKFTREENVNMNIQWNNRYQRDRSKQ